MFDTLKKLFVIIEKNIKRLLSSKISASTIIFGPLIMILLIGLAFSGSGFFGIKVGVYSEKYTDISEKIIDAMEKNSFEVRKIENSEKCISQVRDAVLHLCIIFPKDYTTDKMEFHVDYSRMNLVYTLISKISDQVTELSSKISLGITEDLLETMETAAAEMNESKNTIEEMRMNAAGLRLKMILIQKQLDGMDTISGTESIYAITDNSSKLNKQIKQAKADVAEMKSDVEEIRESLTPLKNDMKTSKTNMNIAMNTFSCANNTKVDLSNSLLTDSFTEDLLRTSNPLCALLNTFKVNLEKQEKDLDDLIKNLDDTIVYLNAMQTNINLMEAQVKEDAGEAKTSIQNLNEAKKNLSREMGNMASAVNQSLVAFDGINEKIDTMMNAFGQSSDANANSIVKPIKTQIKSLSAKKQNTLDLLFPAVLVMIIMFVGILLGNILVMKEKTSKAFFRNLILPVKDYVFIAGTYLTSLIVTGLQITVVIFIGMYGFESGLMFNFAKLIPILIVSIIIFTSIGMIIGYLSSSEETAVLVAIILSVTLMMFSNIVIPIETMEKTLGIIATYTPFNISELFLRRTLIFGTDLLSFELIYLLMIISQIALFIFFVYLAHKKEYSKKR